MKTILVLTDFSEKASHAAEYALNIARRVRADLLLYHSFVVPENTSSHFKWTLEEYYDIHDDVEVKLKELSEHLEEKIRNNNFKPAIKYKCSESEGELGNDIKQILEDNTIWMIVMGSKGNECMSNLRFGTNGYSVIGCTNCPVLFVPGNAPIKDISKMAIATETTELAPLSFLNELRESFDPDILIADAIPPEELLDKNKELVKVSKYIHSSTYKDEDGQADKLKHVAKKDELDLLGVVYSREQLLQKKPHYDNFEKLESERLPLLVSYV